MVLRRCRALLRNDAKAQDAMQDVFVALLRHRDRLQDESPAALLLRVATNVSLRARWFSANSIVGPTYRADVFQLDLTARF